MTRAKVSAGAASLRGPTMLAAVISAPRTLEVVEVHRPVPAAGQVLVRLEGCGVCSSNREPWEGRPWFEYPMPAGHLGHEGWGWVHTLGEGVQHLRAGDRVAVWSHRSFAEFDVADADCVIPLPESLRRMPVPVEPLGCAFNIVRRSMLMPGEIVAVVGMGFLGLLLTQIIKHRGASVLAISARNSGLQAASRRGAIPVDGSGSPAQVLDRVLAATGGRLCARVIEAAGTQHALDLATQLAAPAGRIIIAGYHQDGLRQVDMQQWNWRGNDIICAHERDKAQCIMGMRQAVDSLDAGWFNPLPLYTHQFPLQQLHSALDLLIDRPNGHVKSIIRLADPQLSESVRREKDACMC